ncbi:AbiH family protein [Chryseobacterium sp. RRHN12]|uniref:AbiH family protein n=1 Tax=Chryseobacterium sp. RRHN12 TaxID=3437884 RepID=UPI003D9B3B6E
MEKVLIIGNGFDLRHFLPTKYNHFICILREIESSNIVSDFNFENLFSNQFQRYDSFFYEKIKEFYTVDDLKFKKDDLNKIKTKLGQNLWYKHFKSIDDSHIETWIDFETEINRVLEDIVNLFDKLDNKIKNSNSSFNGIYYYDYRYNSEDHFDSSLTRILLTNLEIFLPSSDSGRFDLNDEYCFKIGNEVQIIHKNRILNNLYYSLQEFTGIFNDYFYSIVSKFYEKFREEKKDKFLKHHDINLLDSIDKIYSFNYTKTVEKLYSNKEIDYLHGQVIEDWNDLDDLKIVLGVDDLDQNLKKHKLFNFTKYFQKLHKQTDFQFLHDIGEISSHTFYFWGHSLDISDKEYIREVFDQLDQSKSKIFAPYIIDTKIIIFYHSISSKADLLNNLLSIIGKDEIEGLMKQKRLTFVQATEDNLFNVINN